MFEVVVQVQGQERDEGVAFDGPRLGERITRHRHHVFGPSAYVSVFAGRIADTGRDPLPMMAASVEMLRPYPQLELLWASPRELLNIFQANAIGCHIITVTHDIIKKLALAGKDLHTFSLETVQAFREDAIKAGFSLDVNIDIAV